jgi:hypothetical protein
MLDSHNRDLVHFKVGWWIMCFHHSTYHHLQDVLTKSVCYKEKWSSVEVLPVFWPIIGLQVRNSFKQHYINCKLTCTGPVICPQILRYWSYVCETETEEKTENNGHV